MTTEQHTLAARFNNVHTKSSCAVCGQFDRDRAVELYIDDTDDRVCEPCARNIDPALADAVAWYWREVGFAADFYDLNVELEQSL